VRLGARKALGSYLIIGPRQSVQSATTTSLFLLYHNRLQQRNTHTHMQCKRSTTPKTPTPTITSTNSDKYQSKRVDQSTFTIFARFLIRVGGKTNYVHTWHTHTHHDYVLVSRDFMLLMFLVCRREFRFIHSFLEVFLFAVFPEVCALFFFCSWN